MTLPKINNMHAKETPAQMHSAPLLGVGTLDIEGQPFELPAQGDMKTAASELVLDHLHIK